MDIHNYKRRLERTVENIQNSDISAENKKLIFKFRDNCFTEGLSISKIERYLYDVHKFTKMVDKYLLDASRDDLKAIVAQIEQKEWSPHSKHGFKVMIRKFYKSIEGPDEKGVYPERVKWLHSNVKQSSEKTPSELVSETDVKQMIAHAGNARDRALIAVLYESGCRISEVGLMKIKDVSFDQYGAIINVAGKTGARRVRLVTSGPYLQEWINHHEFNYDPNNYVWIQRSNGKIISYARFVSIIKRNALAVGIKKRIYPHLFRHSRATFLANKLTEAQMKQYLGWTQSSKMAAVYVHLSGRDTDNAILGLNGIKIQKEEEIKEELKPKTCIRCNKIHPATTKFCDQCGLILDDTEARKFIQVELEKSQFEESLSKVLGNKELVSKLLEKMGEVQVKN